MIAARNRLIAAVAAGDVNAARAVLAESQTEIGPEDLEKARRLALAGRALAARALLTLNRPKDAGATDDHTWGIQG